MKKIVALLVLAVVPMIAHADNVGGCGWGAKLFDGQRGIAPQVLAVTTNGTSGNQTFAITSGTSGCTQDGVVKSSWRTAAFLDGNMNRFAMDVSRGEGETLESLASLLTVTAEDKGHFKAALQASYASLFANSNVSSIEVANALREVLANNAELSNYAANV